MTGVSPFLFFHKHTIITIKDATIMSQSFTHMDAGTQPQNKDAVASLHFLLTAHVQSELTRVVALAKYN